MSEELTQEELMQLQQYLGGGAPSAEEKHNVHTFLHNVSVSDDTTKTGNVDATELGSPKWPIRTHKNMALVSKYILDNEYFADFFNKESEVITSTSLSKEAKLLNLAVVTRRELADVTKPKKVNKGWFGNKKESEEQV